MYSVSRREIALGPGTTSKQQNRSRGRSLTAGAHHGTLTHRASSAKCTGVDDLASRTLRELLTLARERLGRGAAGLKTREELIDALRSAAASPVELAPATAQRGTSGPPPRAGGTASAAAQQVGPAGGVVTRDFFITRH